jgi:hypothetical protein
LTAFVGRAPRAGAGGLVDLFRDPALAGLNLEPIGPVLASTVASTYPVASASSSVTYTYNPALETFERRTRVLGPFVGERAETVGAGQLDVGLSYSYVHLATINGHDLDALQSRRTVGGRFIFFPIPGGATLRDGRFANFLPVSVVTDLDVTAHIVAPSLTYGLTPDLDLNVTLPIIRTLLDVTADVDVPDPRFPQFRLAPGDPNGGHRRIEVSDVAEGVGDLLLRAKYVLLRERPVDLALGLGLGLPTGEVDDFQGTGDTHVLPGLILSRVFADRFEPLLNLGIDLNADDVGRSIVRWALGGTAQVVGPLTAALVFLGRHELERQTEPIARPFFFQIERNDIYDASIGLRYRFAETGVVSLNAIVPLNDDGLRPEVIPTFGIEYGFSAPWSDGTR